MARKKIDTSNTDPAYWEKILEQSNLGVDQGSMGETNQKNAILEYLENAEFQPIGSDQIPSGFTSSEDLGAQYGKKKDIFEQLRWKFDGSDQFVAGGHGVRGVGSTRHAERVSQVPDWANDDAQIRTLLLRSFPKLATDLNQRRRAGAWLIIIYLYFRRGFTRSRIVLSMNWTEDKVASLIKNIRRAVRNRRTDKPFEIRGLKKRGRTSANTAPLPATIEGSA